MKKAEEASVTSKKIKKAPLKKKRKFKQTTDSEKNNFAKKTRPNYFIGIQIKSPSILGKIHAVQKFIVSLDPRLSRAVVPISTTHITLGVFFIKEENVLRVAELLESELSKVLNILGSSGLHINLNGLGSFHNDVLFANISCGEDLDKLIVLSDHLVNCCNEFCDPILKDFKPHVTLMKLSKLRGPRHQKVKKIHPCLYQSYKNIKFGSEKAASIQLLSMMKKKEANGYYHSECELLLDSVSSDDAVGRWSLHHWAECIAVSCITSALFLTKTSVLSQFSNFVSDQILQDAAQVNNIKNPSHRETPSNDRMKTKLKELKKTLNSADVQEEIFKRINKT